jgi:hypothetical protein
MSQSQLHIARSFVLFVISRDRQSLQEVRNGSHTVAVSVRMVVTPCAVHGLHAAVQCELVRIVSLQCCEPRLQVSDSKAHLRKGRQ